MNKRIGMNIKNTKGNSVIIGLVVVALIVGVVVLVSRGGGESDVVVTTEGVSSAMEIENTNESAVEGEEGSMTKGDSMMQKGSYEAYAPEKIAWAEDNDVVLFFHASWCPTCRSVDADITVNISDIPEGLIILKTDYDNSSDLKKKYKVTTQHTFVQVDKDGNMISKWTGSGTLDTIVSKVK